MSMENATQQGQKAANTGANQPNYQGMSQAQAQEAKRAFDEQKAKNDANKK